MLRDYRPLWRYACLGIILLGIVLRVADLDERPMHHDESIHATFSYQWNEAPDRSYYKYDPTYHGPFLYSVTRWFFPLFGVGVSQARLFPLIFGILVLFSPLFFVPWLGRVASLLALLILAVSPLMVYYARFLAHDMPSIFFAIAALACFLRYGRATRDDDRTAARRWLCLAMASLGVLFSIKAVAFLYSFIYLTFLLFAWALMRFPKPFDGDKERLASEAKLWFLGSTVFLFAYGFFQTSLFNNPEGFVDGLFGKVFTYWWKQHNIERVKGPVTFHLRSMLLHALPIVAVLTVSMTLLVKRLRFGKGVLAALALLGLATVPAPWVLAEHLPEWLVSVLGILKMKASPDLFLFSLCFVFGILGGLQAYREERLFDAFLIYFTFSTLAIYSYVGEKVPWLTTHVEYPAVLLAAKELARLIEWLGARTAEEDTRLLLKRRVAVGMACFFALYQARLAYYVTHVTAGEPSDLLSQVHNNKDVKFVVDWMKRTALETGDKTAGISVAIAGTPTWAYYFYFIQEGFKRFVLDTKQLDGSQRFVVLDDTKAKEVGERLVQQGYRASKMIHSGWWVPEHHTLTWADWVKYALWRTPTGSPGTTTMHVYYKPLDAVAPPPPAPAPPPEATRNVASPGKK